MHPDFSPSHVSVFILLVLSIGMHEASHARVGSYFGDPTPEMDGVNTWNPIPHIMRSWLMCLVVPAVMWFFMNFFIGGAYVMLNESMMRPRRLGYFCSVAAGPGMNLALAIFFGLIYLVLAHFTTDPAQTVPLIFLQAGAWNILLLVFNLIPVPPLDGSSMLATAVPATKPAIDAMRGAAFWVLMIVLWNSETAAQFLTWPVSEFTALLFKVHFMLH
ncbi:MAG: site-2 protease family protein [Planctomycetota bacterium]